MSPLTFTEDQLAIIRQQALERFLAYVKINTRSAEEVEQIPSTSIQFDLAKKLVNELQELNLQEIKLSENAIVTATLPSNTIKSTPTIAFIAHLDTSPEESGENVNPQRFQYAGGTITLPHNNLTITPEEIPELKLIEGEEIITTDGTTLLGADDKAGIAEIMAALTFLTQNPEIEHGPIRIMFTPDEEVGKGADKVDVPGLRSDFAYTIDGGWMGELEAECFNADRGTITIHGYNVHPGEAYGKLKNAIRYIGEVMQIFPVNEAPETTQEKEGYYHPMGVIGGINEVKIHFILRDFDRQSLEQRKQHIETQLQHIQTKYPDIKFDVQFKEQYRNMKEVLDKYPHVTKIAEQAITESGVKIIHKAIRGGTDGARLSFMGLPTPNIFTGGMNMHSKKEFIPIIALQKATEVILRIVNIVLTLEK